MRKTPALTVDGIVLLDGKIVLVMRGRPPFEGMFALPGGFVNYGETLEDAVVREAREETGLLTRVKRLVGVFSAPDRDPRGHTVSAVYELEVISGELKGGDDAASASVFPLDEIPPLAFDHGKIIETYRGLNRPGS